MRGFVALRPAVSLQLLVFRVAQAKYFTGGVSTTRVFEAHNFTCAYQKVNLAGNPHTGALVI